MRLALWWFQRSEIVQLTPLHGGLAAAVGAAAFPLVRTIR